MTVGRVAERVQAGSLQVWRTHRCPRGPARSGADPLHLRSRAAFQAAGISALPALQDSEDRQGASE